MSSHSHTTSSSSSINDFGVFLESHFPSFMHLENAVVEFSKDRGFCYVKRSTSYVDKEIDRAILVCTNGYNPASAKVKRPKEQLCPFRIVATRCSSTGFFKVTTFVDKHNHPLNGLAARFGARNHRLTQVDRAEILELKAANVKVANILAVLANRSDKYITKRQLYNTLCGTAQKKIAGMSECSKLLAFVGSSPDLSGWYSVKEESSALDTPLRGVFISFNQNVARFRKAPQALLIDGTFGVNKFNQPVTLFASKDEHDIMFCVGFSLMGTQTTASYAWALKSFALSIGEEAADAIEVIFTDRELALFNAIEQVLPASRRQLCQWHIRKDVATHIGKRTEFDDDAKKEYSKAFNRLIGCKDSSKYLAVRTSLLEAFPACAAYTRSWLTYEKHFVECFVSANFNLGIRTTQGVESLHHSLKQFLDYTAIPLQTLAEAFLKKSQDSVDRAMHSMYLSLTSSKAFPEVFANLRGTLSSPALSLLFSQLDNLRLQDFEVFSHEGSILVSPKANRTFNNIVAYVPVGHSTCNCSFYAQYKLPCMHIIACFKQFSGVITVHAVHSRWLIGALNASIPLTVSSEDQQSGDENEGPKDAVSERDGPASANPDIDAGSLFDEAFEEFCLSCRKQRFEGVNASHVAFLQKAVRDAKEAFGERRAIGPNIVQVSDILPNKKRGRPAAQHRLKARNEDEIRKLMDTGK